MDIEKYRQDILDPEKGYFLIRGFLNQEAVDDYRTECAEFLDKGPRLYSRINTRNIFDYIHPRTIGEEGQILPKKKGEIPATFRIYQFFHNNHSQNTQEIFNKTLTLRDSIESNWMRYDAYRKETESLQNYVIVTRYIYDKQGLPKHRDYRGPAQFPLLQCLIILSQPGKDYEGGEFTLHTNTGPKLKLQKDLDLQKGDAFFFDKRIDHEVSPTSKVNGSDVGRWSVLIGARAKYRGDSPFVSRLKYSPLMVETIKPLVQKVLYR